MAEDRATSEQDGGIGRERPLLGQQEDDQHAGYRQFNQQNHHVFATPFARDFTTVSLSTVARAERTRSDGGSVVRVEQVAPSLASAPSRPADTATLTMATTTTIGESIELALAHAAPLLGRCHSVIRYSKPACAEQKPTLSHAGNRANRGSQN